MPESDDDGGTWRVTLRMPESLRSPVDAAARAEGLSVNAWLVRAVAAALGGPAPLACQHRQELQRLGPLSNENQSGETMPTFPTPRPDHGLRRGGQRLGPRRRHRPRGHRGRRSARAIRTGPPMSRWPKARASTSGTAPSTVSAGRRFVSLGRGGAVTIDIELPSRSRLQVSSASAQVRADGEFGECRFSTASGDVSRRLGCRKHQGGHRVWRCHRASELARAACRPSPARAERSLSRRRPRGRRQCADVLGDIVRRGRGQRRGVGADRQR